MHRDHYLAQITAAFTVHPVVAILGPRQCGKTTLARQYLAQFSEAAKASDTPACHYFDLENPQHLARLDDPMLALGELSGLIIVDEIQLRPELFPVLRVLVDEHQPGRAFLILGSASRDLIRQSSETLAGRIQYLELTPFAYPEVGDLKQLWLRGGFPRSYLADSDQASLVWRNSYITTFLERDIPNLGIRIPPRTLRRFWMMLTHYHGNIFNASELGQSLGASHTTIRHYLDILTGTFVVRELQPWLENIKKRQIKSPKIYFRDSGLYHSLLGVTDQASLLNHPKLGASWEGLALEEIIRYHEASVDDVYYWGIHGGGELDLLIFKDGKRLGFEFKYSSTPQLTRSMETAQDILALDSLTVIVPGTADFPLSKTIRVHGIEHYLMKGDQAP